MTGFERFIAFRYLRSGRREGFVSVIAAFSLGGIALGVGTLVVVMAVMNGFRHELLGRILSLSGHMTVQAFQGPLPSYDPLAERLREIPNIVSVAPVVIGQVMASSGRVGAGAVVRGMRLEDLMDRGLFKQGSAGSAVSGSVGPGIKSGDLDDLNTRDSVMIGIRMAEQLGLAVDDAITLISPNGRVTVFGTVPRMRTFRVAAIFEIGMYEYDSGFVYMSLEAAQEFFQLTGAVSALEIMTDNPDNVQSFRAPILEASAGGVRLQDWSQSSGAFFKAVEVEQNVMRLILGLIILVAAFNIVSSLILLVKDKGRDIAILRTMGASQGAVTRIFVLSGTSVGVIGTVTGLVLGLLFAYNIEEIRQFIQWATGYPIFPAEVYFLSEMPSWIDWREMIGIGAMGVGLSLIATLYPSLRAARLDPVEALRYE